MTAGRGQGLLELLKLQVRAGDIGEVARKTASLAAYGSGRLRVGRRLGNVTTAALRLRRIDTDGRKLLNTTTGYSTSGLRCW